MNSNSYLSALGQYYNTSIEISDPNFLQVTDISIFGTHLPTFWPFFFTLRNHSNLSLTNFSICHWSSMSCFWKT